MKPPTAAEYASTLQRLSDQAAAELELAHCNPSSLVDLAVVMLMHVHALDSEHTFDDLLMGLGYALEATHDMLAEDADTTAAKAVAALRAGARAAMEH